MPQLVGIAFLAVAAAGAGRLNPHPGEGQVRRQDEDKRAYVKEPMASEDERGDDRGLERWYYRNVLLRGGMRLLEARPELGEAPCGAAPSEQRKGGGEGTLSHETLARFGGGDTDAGGGGATSRGSVQEDTKHPRQR